MAFNPKKISTPKNITDFISTLESNVRSLHAISDELRGMDGPRGRKEWMSKVLQLEQDSKDVITRFSYRVTEYTYNATSGLREEPDYGDLLARAKEVDSRFTSVRDSVNRDVEPAPGHDAGGSSANDPPPYPPRVKEMLFGIDGPREMLVKWLLDEEKRLQVVSIVGPAGSGKTALAREIYHRIESKFEFPAQVIGYQQPDPMEVLKQILSRVHVGRQPSGSEDWEQWQLIRHIREYLQIKRYLIIIDGIWDKKCWEVIHSVFPKNNFGSRVMMTTRVVSIARLCRSHRDGLVYYMKPLTVADSQSLLLKGAPSLGDTTQLGEACSLIWQTYDGNPLAMIAIADKMSEQKKKMSEQKKTSMVLVPWLKDFCKLQRAPNLKGIKQVLSHDYDDFISDKELYFLYMSLFPGCKVEKDRLLRRWVAEKFVTSESDSTTTVEEKAQEYLSEFIDKNIIRLVKHGSNSKVETCKADYLMIQVMLCNSPLHDYVITSDTLDQDKSKAPYLSLHHHHDPKLDAVLEGMDLSSTHSLTISDPVLLVHLHKFTHLQVLGVEGWKKLVDEDMLKICKMYLLKYLSIRKTLVRVLPPEIKQLCHLETLDIRETEVKQLPSELCKIDTLKTLDLRKTEIEVLPNKVSQLPGLLHLLVGDDNNLDKKVKTPEWIRHVRSLKTLATVDFCECSSTIVRSLSDLTNLRELAIIWPFDQSYKIEYQESLRSFIQKLRMLKSLTIYTDFDCSMEFLAHGRPDLPRKLEKLMVAGRFVSVPHWVVELQDLAFLKVTVCKFEGKDLEILAALRRLRCLELGLEFYPEQEIVIENLGFRVLERFCVDCRVPWLSFEAGAMPQLTELELKFFSDLTGQESALLSGISNLISLEQVILQHAKLYDNNSLVEAMKTEVRKHRNPIKLFINNTEDDGKASSTAEPSLPEQEMMGRKSSGAEGDANEPQAAAMANRGRNDTVLMEASNPMVEATAATINTDGGRMTITAGRLAMLGLILNQVSMTMSTDDGVRITENEGNESNHAEPSLPMGGQVMQTKMLGSEKNAKKEEAQQLERHAAATACEGRRSGLASGHGNVVRGMKNLGNTCYFNAVLQSLLALGELRTNMLEQDPPAGSLRFELKKLIEETSGANDAGGTLEPEKLFSIMSSRNPDFKLGVMEDSNNVLGSLLDSLNNEKPAMVESLFRGQVAKHVFSKECEHTSVTTEGLDLSLAIPSKQPVSIEDCLNLYVNGEIEGWHCTNCSAAAGNASLNQADSTVDGDQIEQLGTEIYQKEQSSDPAEKQTSTLNQDKGKLPNLDGDAHQMEQNDDKHREEEKIYRAATVQFRIRNAPPLLTIQLKRFDYVHHDRSDKLKEHVSFQETLDITKFMDPGYMANEEYKYCLAAVIVHNGPILSEGHNFAYVRTSRIRGQQQESSGTSSWFRANDENVKKVSLEKVLKCQAYILFYERVEQSKVKTSLETHSPTNH